MIEIMPAARLGEGYRRAVTEVFIDGFGTDLAYFSDDPGKLVDALAHMLVLDVFHVGLIDGQPASIVALTDGGQLSVRHDGAVLRKHLGLIKGTIADVMFKKEFQKAFVPPRPRMASLEFVSTAHRFRGRGAASAVLRHLLALPQYDEYVLEDISDINAPALHLYKKLGFTEYKRKKVNHTKRTGINFYVSMHLSQV
ncbi:GNAT family N-acetyltransferase [Nonomuraea longicatena]|uniref:N-acetyltransferase domain-containing protein n=1 Tax=Nonomuraea longicatena TaxID=83682 RepID=A0ABN1NXE3_9ACTN